ncbi:hypothetical protein IWQ60_004216 [Tieghemiomyces parasiticus]|uniref:Uncharacterized protein n=1 Tax=Tieghemiomyces parasiticus TaxID=78921 RepID=A0A9W8A8S8_9FUNG|nr:hypothetical protein IWQ60_004216 [Tieghemiomyces parasiticus]
MGSLFFRALAGLVLTTLISRVGANVNGQVTIAIDNIHLTPDTYTLVNNVTSTPIVSGWSVYDNLVPSTAPTFTEGALYLYSYDTPPELLAGVDYVVLVPLPDNLDDGVPILSLSDPHIKAFVLFPSSLDVDYGSLPTKVPKPTVPCYLVTHTMGQRLSKESAWYDRDPGPVASSDGYTPTTEDTSVDVDTVNYHRIWTRLYLKHAPPAVKSGPALSRTSLIVIISVTIPLGALIICILYIKLKPMARNVRTSLSSYKHTLLPIPNNSVYDCPPGPSQVTVYHDGTGSLHGIIVRDSPHLTRLSKLMQAPKSKRMSLFFW